MIGWGKIKHPGSSHPILQQAMMPPIDPAKCRQRIQASGGALDNLVDFLILMLSALCSFFLLLRFNVELIHKVCYGIMGLSNPLFYEKRPHNNEAQIMH